MNSVRSSLLRRGIFSSSLRYARPTQFATSPLSRLISTTSFDPEEGFARAAFSGKISEGQVFPYPDTMDSEEKEMISTMLDAVRKFFEINDPILNDEQEKVPDEIMQAAKDLGVFGMQVPDEYGGLAFSNTGYARMSEVLGDYLDLGFALTLGAHQSIGFKGLMLYGTDAQKEKYLPRLATGEWLAAFALTEPSAGSDANSIKTRAVLSDDGTHYVINGSKLFITNGGTAEFFTLFAQTEVEDKRTGKKKDKMTAFIVERSFGVQNGPPEKKMGIRASNTTELFLEDVKVPVENVLGEVGGGFKIAMGILNNGRFGMGAALAGIMRGVTKIAAEHAMNRGQFGSKLQTYGVIKEKIGSMALRLYATEAVAYLVSNNMDRGSDDYHIEAAISKIFSSENAWWATDEAIQILGGSGFIRGNHVERVQRDLRIFRIFEGANEILRLFISLTGCQAAGNDLKTLQKALQSPLNNIGVVGDAVSTRAKRLAGIPDDRVQGAHPSLSNSATLLEQNVAQFGSAVEGLLRTHGKSIIDEQVQLKRLADACIDIYSMVAVISRASKALDASESTADADRLLAETWCTQADSRVRHNLKLIRDSSSGRTTDAAVAKIADMVFGNDGRVPVSHVSGV